MTAEDDSLTPQCCSHWRWTTAFRESWMSGKPHVQFERRTAAIGDILDDSIRRLDYREKSAYTTTRLAIERFP